MTMNRKLFAKGFRHGIPIGLGYLSVAFTFGMKAVADGLSPLEALLIFDAGGKSESARFAFSAHH